MRTTGDEISSGSRTKATCTQITYPRTCRSHIVSIYGQVSGIQRDCTNERKLQCQIKVGVSGHDATVYNLDRIVLDDLGTNYGITFVVTPKEVR